MAGEIRAQDAAAVLGMEKPLDLITIGRSSVDLYGGQIGGRLEDMASFSKYIGGSPTNIAVGAARLGLRAALITRVGDEHMGRFIREELEREGVDIRGVQTDPERLTALVLLGIRDDSRFPLIFYRENCADMALSTEDIDPDFIAEARCVCVTGTHLSNPQTEAAVLKALELARNAGAKTALDIDFRPNLWGLAGHGHGESRYIESRRVTEKLQMTLGLFDLIVGTEEEFHIAGGSGDTVSALAQTRSQTSAALVCKRGPLGAVAFDGDIPGSLDDGQTGPGIDIEVFNVLGAGDGFMAGLLSGWLAGCDWPDALRTANVCGAFAVSRHGCAPSYPSRQELDFFFDRGQKVRALRNDAELEQVHWATTRKPAWPALRIFDCSRAAGLENAIDGQDSSCLARFQSLCLDAVKSVAKSRTGYGIVLDGPTGRRALSDAAGCGLWIGRRASEENSRPLAASVELGPDLGGLAEWPANHVVHVHCSCHPKDSVSVWAAQAEFLERIFAMARRFRLETILQISQSGLGNTDDMTCASTLGKLYSLGIFPDWWALEPAPSETAWRQIGAALSASDPHCRGIVLTGGGSRDSELAEQFDCAARNAPVNGFSSGPDLLMPVAKAWMDGSLSEKRAVKKLARRFGDMCKSFDRSVARSHLPI